MKGKEWWGTRGYKRTHKRCHPHLEELCQRKRWRCGKSNNETWGKAGGKKNGSTPGDMKKKRGFLATRIDKNGVTGDRPGKTAK